MWLERTREDVLVECKVIRIPTGDTEAVGKAQPQLATTASLQGTTAVPRNSGMTPSEIGLVVCIQGGECLPECPIILSSGATSLA